MKRLNIKSPAIARVEPTVLVVTDLKDHPKSMIFTRNSRMLSAS